MEINETLYRVEITVRYGEPKIEKLKELGCQWDGQARVWWIGRLERNADMIRDFVSNTTATRSNFARECERRRASGFAVKVPYDQRDIAKQHGGIWDAFLKQWLMPSMATAELVQSKLKTTGHSKTNRRAA